MELVAAMVALACLFARHALGQGCDMSGYYNGTDGSCLPCSNCTAEGRLEYSPCSASADAVCFEPCPGGSFFNGTGCQVCSACSNPVKKQCTNTSDTVCNACRAGFVYNTLAQSCIINCIECPSGECESGTIMCKCDPCMIGDRCQFPDPTCSIDQTTNPPTNVANPTQATETSSFSPITSALVAVGAVLGIVIFSVLFVLLGVATSCRRNATSPDNAELSNGSTETHIAGRPSSSLTSLYANHQSPSSLTDYRTPLDFSALYNSHASSSSPRLGRPHSAPSRNRDRVWTPV